MTILVTLALTVLAFAFITYPLIRQRLRSVGAAEDEAAEDEAVRELHSRRDTTYSMLKELEFDKESGILSEEDYRDLETRYKGKAISILRGIDELDKSSDMGETIEEQVQKLRRGKKSDVAEDVEREILSLRRGKGTGRFCTKCGARCQEDDRFCARCGAPLRQGGQG